MANVQIKERKVVELHPHPKNDSIYGDEDIERSKWVKPITALPAAMRYILKAESSDRRGARGKLYCIIAGSAVEGHK